MHQFLVAIRPRPHRHALKIGFIGDQSVFVRGAIQGVAGSVGSLASIVQANWVAQEEIQDLAEELEQSKAGGYGKTHRRNSP